MADRADRWTRSARALYELLVIVVVFAGVALLGNHVSEPVTRLENCAGVVRFELAVPDDTPQVGLRAFSQLRDQCVAVDDRPTLAAALRSSTIRDFWLIPAYVFLLAWCGARIGGVRHLRPAQVRANVGSQEWKGMSRFSQLLADTPAEAELRDISRGSRPSGDRAEAIAAVKARESADPQRPKLGVGRRLTRTVLRGIFSRLALAPVDRNDATRLAGQVGAWSAVAAGVLDAAENAGLLDTANHLSDPSVIVLSLTASAAAAKFALLLLPIGLFFMHGWQLVQASIGSRRGDATKDAVVLPKAESARDFRWALPVIDEGGALRTVANDAKGDRYGVCFSGGGIRSATFSLGAMQALEDPDLDQSDKAAWSIGRARYLSSVSGGSYFAATYQFLARGSTGGRRSSDDLDKAISPGLLHRIGEHLPLVGTWLEQRRKKWRRDATKHERVWNETDGAAEPPPRPLVPRAGLVEDHLRRYSSHLADGAAEWVVAIGEVLLRALTGLFILLLGVWSIGVPLGWVFRFVYHGVARDAASPTIDLRTAAGPVLVLVAFAFARLIAFAVSWLFERKDEHGRRVTRAREQARAATSFGVALVVALAVVIPFVAANIDSVVNEVGALVVGRDPVEPDRSAAVKHVDAIMAGATKAATGAAKAAAAVEGSDATARASLAAAETNAALASERVNAALRQLSDRVEPDADDERIAAVGFDPRTCAPQLPTKPNDRSLTIRACEAAKAASNATAAVGDLAQALATAGDARTPAAAAVAEGAALATAGSAAAAESLDALAKELSGTAPRSQDDVDPPVAWAGLSAFVTAAGGLLAKRRLDVANRPKGAGEKGSNRVARMLGFGNAVEVLAGVLTAAVLLIAISDVIEDAWSRGPRGDMKIVVTQPGWVWWGGAISVFVIVMNRIDVNTWSLRPFYHRRLWLPYAVRADGETADWRTDTRLSVLGRRVPGYPELIVCAAAQTSGRDWAPPGRRALSYVFTADACGGPEVGYVNTRALERLLGPRRRTPVTLFGAIATSGAAFGPAMGRHSKGGLGAVIAIANARLGAWLPNPHHLVHLAAASKVDRLLRTGAFAASPRLWYWLMEIIGQYPTDAKLVLTTDGGHVENLGLMELVRRRCNRILCFDASGAGATPATLAEAIVLAREELDVRITLQVASTSSTSAVTADDAASEEADDEVAAAVEALLEVDTSGADPLLRAGGLETALAARLAKRPVLVCRIEYPEVRYNDVVVPESTGWIVYGTLALSAADADDWDLLEFSQRNGVFPGDGTLRQWFDAATFSAYQQLGRRTAQRMLAVAVALEQAEPTVVPST